VFIVEEACLRHREAISEHNKKGVSSQQVHILAEKEQLSEYIRSLQTEIIMS
jgi:hypothetical protein